MDADISLAVLRVSWRGWESASYLKGSRWAWESGSCLKD